MRYCGIVKEQELKTELTPVYKVLVEPLDSEDGDILREQLAVTEALIARIATLKRQASQALAVASEKNLPPKSKEMTELDRKIKMESATASEAYVEGLLADYEKKLYNRVSLGQSILSSLTIELKRQL